MAAEADKIPFLRQLVDSDRKVRERAISALESYLASGRSFSTLELLKLWRGLYFAMYHTPLARSGPLIGSITSLTLALPVSLFLPFGAAFWRTVAEQHPQLDAHRVDKYLLLMRRFLRAQLAYLRDLKWNKDLLAEFTQQITDRSEGPLGIGGPDEVVGDGIRYHVLDVWVDEVGTALETEKEKRKERVLAELKAPVDGLVKDGRSKILRARAEEVAQDERWEEIRQGKTAATAREKKRKAED